MTAIACFNGQINGYVMFEEVENNRKIECLVTIKLSNFLPNRTHAIHIHESSLFVVVSL